MGRVIETAAYHNSAFFDTWEFFSYDRWLEAFACGLDPDFITTAP